MIKNWIHSTTALAFVLQQLSPAYAMLPRGIEPEAQERADYSTRAHNPNNNAIGTSSLRSETLEKLSPISEQAALALQEEIDAFTDLILNQTKHGWM